MIRSRAQEYGTRARRGARGELRVWVPMILIIGLLMLKQYSDRRQDTASARGEPWVSATLEIVRDDVGLGFNYIPAATRDMSGEWTAVIRPASRNGIARWSTRRGKGNYLVRNNDRPATFWPWDAFFEGDTTIPPSVPADPFVVCLTYRLIAPSGVVQNTGPFCSNTFDPNQEDDR